MTDIYTKTVMYMLVFINVIGIWNQATYIQDLFSHCMEGYQIRLCFESVLLTYLSLLMLFGYHSACQQIYNFSVHKRLATDMDEKRRFIIALLLGILAAVALLSSILFVIFRPPRDEKKFIELNVAASWIEAGFQICIALGCFYCTYLLKQARAVSVFKYPTLSDPTKIIPIFGFTMLSVAALWMVAAYID